MIFDCFPFNNEFIVLQIRLNELKDVVDKFIITESEETFRGDPKPLWLTSFLKDGTLPPELADRDFSDILDLRDKIHIEVSPRAYFENPWDREYEQKNHVAKGLARFNPDPDDLVVLSDCDEVPRASTLASLVLGDRPTLFLMHEYYYSLNLELSYYGLVRVLRAGDFVDFKTTRYIHPDDMDSVPEAGWHFSYLMPTILISRKIKSFSHSELDSPFFHNPSMINARIINKQDLFDRVPLHRKEIDDTWPQYVLDNIGKYKEFVR
jgi:beta-1,4-mannosyl-glycoprotein beta-1,4-N-acetylglucosaminyltransferase